MKPELLQSLVDRARQEELGIIVETNNVPMTKLYINKFAASIDDYEFKFCSIDETHFALLRKTVELDYDLTNE